jgi:predicted site-specific integrase-resolvase
MMNTPYVAIEDLAKHLSVSISTIRGWVRNKYIPENTYIRVVNTYRFHLTDVVDALSAAKDQTAGAPVDTVDIAEQDEDL